MEESSSRAESSRDSVPDLRIGSYRVLEPLGSGGMSTVYRAVHTQTGHEVALKVLIRTLARNSTLLQRFLREARSAETLEHPSIVAIFDRGIDEGRHYLVLEYVQGGDFHDYIQRNGPLGVSEAIGVIRSVASGLRYAASRGLIHRDIKPSNILRTTCGEAKIIDLGLALQSQFEDERVTREGTTVGTVDYMAPEQARDSRATSILSDMYSLGCTLYYLLAGVPPYPGGDITDKLTRHARSPAPDIRDLRPDIPASISAILLRLLAKNPDDRFADYDQLIAALESAPLNRDDQAPAIALAPLESEQGNDWLPVPAESWAALPPMDAPSNGSGEELVPMESFVGLAELAGESRPAQVRTPVPGPTPTIPRSGGFALEPEAEEPESQPDATPPRDRPSAPAWVLSVTAIGASLVLLVIGLNEFLGGTPGSSVNEVEPTDPVSVAVLDRSAGPPVRHAGSMPESPARTGRSVRPVPLQPLSADRPSTWKEPADTDPIPGREGPVASRAPDSRPYLPGWARLPASIHTETPFVVVRRVAEPGANPSLASVQKSQADRGGSVAGVTAVVPTLQRALDEFRGGTVELADQGPLAVEDLRVSGDSRLIRARPGFRPILRVDRSKLEASRQHTAVLNLEKKNITLEGFDLILNVPDLSYQTVLFACAGSNLTLRNCTITILNPANRPFTLIRDASLTSRPSRIRLERTVVQGQFGEVGPVIQISGGPGDLVLDQTVILYGTGPLVRISQSDAGSEHRLCFIESVIAGPGPIVQQVADAAGLRSKPLVLRMFGSAVGRLQEPGIASIVSSSDQEGTPAQQVDWAGDRNLFAGWKGFFSRGSDRDPMILVDDLVAVRSTWNATERETLEVLVPWGRPSELDTVSPADHLRPFLPEDRRDLLRWTSRPHPGLFEKTVGLYSSPQVPEPIWRGLATPPAGGAVSRHLQVQVPGKSLGGASPAGPTQPPPAPAADLVELEMNTSEPQWNGDLGAFMRDRLNSATKHVRIRVVGSGAHRFTAVKIPRGIQLEIRVNAVTPAGSEPLSWTSEPNGNGAALIEVHGGALVLSGLILRHDPESRLAELISTEDAHLVLSGCQLIVPPSSSRVTGGLIAFRAATTQSQPDDRLHPVFDRHVDRPVCRVVNSVLIANGTALRAELGRGLIAMTQCAVAGGESALELVPANVARSRFDADLVLDRSTIVSDRTLVRLGAWPGSLPGPNRPWLISSRNCVFWTLTDRRVRDRDVVLLRADADALAGGSLFWQADNDVHELDLVTAAGDASPPPNRARDSQLQWVILCASNHINPLTGPRGNNGVHSVQFRDRPRSGRVVRVADLEPADLILDPEHQPGRAQLDVGADLIGQGIIARPTRGGSRRD
jgi:serine/threonine protein kinase